MLSSGVRMVAGKVFLLALIATLQGVISQSLEQTPISQSDGDAQNSRAILKALFGDDVPCSTGDCDGYGATESSSEYPDVVYTEEGYESQSHSETLEQKPEEVVYDPLYPEAGSEELAPEEEYVEVDLCSNLMETVEALESENPDIASVKVKVMDDLIKYASAFGQASQGEGCDPAVQLLDIVIAAAEKLKEDYQAASDYQCQSTETYQDYTTEEQEYEVTEEDYDHSTMPPFPESFQEQEIYTEDKFEEITKDEPCPEDTTARYEPPTEKPCDEEEEIIAEVDEVYEHHHPSPHFVGSVRGVPGEHYPNYTDIPITSFSCADKKCMPGFYADLETGCQVFHVCYEHRRESFLCPMGTIFNQPILACDFWYSSNCSLALTYYDVNCKSEEHTRTEVDTAVGELVTSIVADKVEHPYQEEFPEISEESLDELAQFLPVKAKVTVFSEVDQQAQSEDVQEVADQIFDNIITTATRTVSKTRDVIAKLPEPVETDVKFQFKPVPVFKPEPVETEVKVQFKKPIPVFKPLFVKSAVTPLKVKAVVPKAKVVGKVVLGKKAVPVAKFVAKAAVPVIKTKLAAKAALPVIAKAKMVAGKTIAAKAAVPIVAKFKAAAVAVPVAKVAAAKTKVAAGKVIAAKVAVPVAVKAKAAVVAKAAAPAAAVVVAKKVVVPAKAAAAKTMVFKAAAVKGPVLKTKILAASLPFGKAAMLKSAVPIGKAKIVPVLKAKAKLASIPVVKGKLMALPLAKSKAFVVKPLLKAKVVKAAMISPLTKKALAIGYMKLLKAKKLALMG